jgi:ABC-type antimicrobial peptide transport system permease subunit
MNIMLVAVSERTREIGLRKAVGANNAGIMGQFLIESIFITSLGGLIGIIGGFVVSYLIYLVANYLGYEWAFVISPLSILLAIGISAVIGLIFGLFPARKASRLEPVEALRYE